MRAVLAEAEALAAGGARELNLIAEDTNQYGMDLPGRRAENLAALLERLSAIEGVDWIRILYAYPSYFGDDLIGAIASLPKVCKYIDIPLQHAADMQLMMMNRPTAAHTRALLGRLRERIPGLVLRSTFIAGFPNETPADHREVLEFMREFDVCRGGAFAYSEEDGTPAAAYEGAVERAVRLERRDRIVALQQELSASFARRRVGERVDVLIDAPGDGADGVLAVGRTFAEAPDVDPVVRVVGGGGGAGPRVGEMLECEVVGHSLDDIEVVPLARK